MTQINWPAAFVLAVIVAVSGTLAAMHVIGGEWIEDTMTGIIGFVLGHALGTLRVKRKPVVVVTPPN